ncbi:redox-regulated ATPase YchF [Candidatus Dojkabacteria bacterium]|nr:redox-regulated ATPase YchF [Candidatus Dojkabacteria bacterium]
MAVKRSHLLSIGIVGLPNSGKSTLFNSITKCSVPAENFPFCTIDKNVGVVKIPDDRLEDLAGHYNARKIVSSAIKFVDIAGLVKGASRGEGLGNKFLSHIREVDVILYVLRAFSSENITHVYNRVDPLEDMQIVESELILKDMDTVKRKIGDLEKLARSNDEKATEMLRFMKELLAHLDEGRPAIEYKMTDDEAEFARELWLLSNKQRMYLLNIREGVEEPELDNWEQELKEYIPKEDHEFVIRADVKLIGELSDMDSAEREEFLSVFDEEPAELDEIVGLAYKRLDLITFYTGNESECNAWTIAKGATVAEAAGVIHSDLEDRFITADVVNVDKLVKLGGWTGVKDAGLIENHSRDYLVQDGDYVVVNNG